MAIHTLGPFRLDMQRELLFHGAEPVPVGRRAIALLRALVDQPRAVVSKEALIDVAWPNQAVEESNLTVQIAALRRVLGQAPGGDRWIETMPRRGYRFIGPVGSETPKDTADAPTQGDAAPDLAPAPYEDTERRQITAVSCELIGQARQADGMDLEEWREAVDAFRRCVSQAIARHDGFVARYLGNTVLVLFGYPAAHEHDAERAVRAGLELCAAVRTLRAAVDAPMRCRVGVATGMVIIGDIAEGGARAPEIVGNTPDLAVQLQASAQPDMVAIDRATRQLVGNLFDCRDLDAIEADGSTEPMRRWQVLGERVVESRFEALRGSALGALVGRDEEIDLLLRRWARAKAGDGQVVLISGEPGIGKSRIAESVLVKLKDEPHARLRYFCSPHHAHSPLHPFVAQLERAAGFEPGSSAQAKLERLAALLKPTARNAPLDLALIADLLSVAKDGRYPDLVVSPQQKRERTFTALLDQLDGVAACSPVLIVFEDAQWIDPTSLDLLDRTIARVADLSVLLDVTFRSEFQPTWVGQAHVVLLPLRRLGRRDSVGILKSVSGGKALPEALVEQVLAHTDGVPLFIEELTKTVLESGLLRETADRYELIGPLPPLAIPSTLHASLLARLDRLGSAKKVAQIGAAIGREFSYELVAAVSALPERELKGALAKLVDAELLFQRGAPPHANYQFKHALVQDAAYGTLLRQSRRALHARIVETMESQFPEIAESQPELLARHCTEAGLIEKATGLWEKAGQRSLSRPAMAEAAVQLRNALDLLTKLPYSEERDRKELDLLVALGVALAGAKGYGGDELHQTNARARELSMRGDTRHLIAVFHGSFLSQLGRNVPAAPPIGEELLRLGRERGDIAAQIVAHRMMGIGFWHLGRPISCRAHLEQALALYDPTRHRSMQSDIAAARGHCLEYLSLVLVPLGYAEQSNVRYQEARAETEQLIAVNPRALRVSGGYFNGCVVQHLRRDVDRTGECADLLVEFARQNGLGPWAAAGKVWQGWVRFGRGEVEGALAQMREGLAEYRAAGTPHVLYYFIMLLADVEATLGFREEGLAHQAEATILQDSLGARGFACDLLRIKGELLALSEDWTDAEACFRQSIALAREQEAPMWELRSAVGLSRLWAAHGRRAEIRNLVAPVYSRFTEGFDTSDLIDAKVLLDETA
jgi:class 3 adenylate cyclase/tetratricopeptide (TPR) repeat protein